MAKRSQDPVIDGKHFYRALSYASRACPAAEGMARFAHVAFIGHRIVCADGERWHVGYLPRECAIAAPFIAARESVQELLLGLEYALKISRRHNQQFNVRMSADGVVVVTFGGKGPIEHTLAPCDVGYIPEAWDEPVPADAPAMASPPELKCGAMKEAMQWYRAWDKDHGTFTLRGAGGNEPVRLDIVSGGDTVACAFLLPTTHPPAYLVHDEPLFASLNPGRQVGQSILDLQLDGDGETSATKPSTLKLTGPDGKSKEWNIAGLDVMRDDLVKNSPCIHEPKGDGPCIPCTSDQIRAAKKAQKKREKEIAEAAGELDEAAPEGETVQ